MSLMESHGNKMHRYSDDLSSLHSIGLLRFLIFAGLPGSGLRAAGPTPVMLIVGDDAAHPLTAKKNEKKMMRKRCGQCKFFLH